MKTYQKIIGKTNYICFLFLIFSVTFANQMFRLCATVWFISWLLEFRFLKRSNFSFNKSVAPLLLFTLFIGFESITLFWSAHVGAGLSTINKQIYFLIFFIIALFGVNKQYNLHTTLTVYIVGCLVSSLVYFFTIFYVTNGQRYFVDPYTHYHFIFPWQQYAELSSFLKHRLYYCTQLTFALIATGYEYPHWKKVYGKVNSVLFTIGIYIMLLFTMYLTGSRASILALGVIGCVYLLIKFKRNKYIVLAIVLLFVGLGLMTIKLHPRFNNITTQEIENVADNNIHNNTDAEPRLIIWSLAFQNWHQYLPFGIGLGSSKAFMEQLYKENNAPAYFLERRYNAHNQYLETTIETGIIGLIFLLICFLSLWYSSQPGMKRFAIYTLLLIMFNLLTESMLGRAEGTLTISIILFLFVLMNRKEMEQHAATEATINGQLKNN